MLGYQSVDHGNYTKLFNPAQYSRDMPESVDWRTKNAVNDIKNQVSVIGLYTSFGIQIEKFRRVCC